METHNLSNLRKVYQNGELLESSCPENPIELFALWFQQAEAKPQNGEANAMTLSTAAPKPQNRVVLLKKFSWEGFYFYTNYNSNKAKDIELNNSVCISFFWQCNERQVIICGKAEKTSSNVSDAYFASRPKGSKLGAIASEQSSVVSSREFLDDKLSELEKQYENSDIPRPENWGGYIVRPQSIEFWQGRPNRMHDRIKYSLSENFEWTFKRLSP